MDLLNNLVGEFTDKSSLADVDTVQELTDILFLYCARLMDAGTDLTNSFKVVSLQLQLILDRLRSGDGNTLWHGDTADDLLSQKVTDFKSGGY